MGWVNLLLGFLRLGPLALGALAAVILGAGYYLQVLDNERMAQEAQALADGMPAIVDLVDARQAAGQSVIGEVNVRAELAWDQSWDLWYDEQFGTDFVVMFPLVAPGSASLGDIVGVALFQAEDESFETLTQDIADAWFVSDGKFGPVMNLNGELDDMGKWQGLVEESFHDDGLQLPADPIVIWPFVEGREVALAPAEAGSWTIFGIVSKVAGAIGLLALGKMVIGRKPEDDIPEPEMAYAGMSAPAAQANDVPLWKQRSGLVDEVPRVHEAQTEPTQFDNTFVNTAPVSEPREVPKRSGFGVRKILICIVGGLFALGLVSTVSDLIGQSSAAQSVSVDAPTAQERAAAGIADLVVPDADPNRHWTDIDVTPVIEWFMAKAMLAIAGDVDAMITLGMIVGGLFFALFGLRFFFVMRRSLRPKTTARFDSMGIN